MADRLAELEWEAFQEIRNMDGPADCQNNRREFDINRKSQFASWSGDTLKNYLEDLEAARENGRNLVWEKYARMMEFTSPLEYPLVEDRLPRLSPRARELAEEIVKKQVAWQEELAGAYPRLFARSRPIRSGEDTLPDSSFETYLRCELFTFSEKTLTSYLEHLKDWEKKNLSMNRICMEDMVRRYGYPSLEAAEASFGK
jgi:hypothetical protein